MNKVFEDFVTTAPRESVVRFGGELRAQWRGRLDVERQLEIIPDLTWWIQGRCAAVADAEYKALAPSGMPNADAYQMLAYCTALRLDCGYLIYAKDAGEQGRTHSVQNSSVAVEVRTLDVEAVPDAVLSQVDVLAEEIAGAGIASSSDLRARAQPRKSRPGSEVG